MATAQIIEANHEKAISIQRLARANQVIPPAWVLVIVFMFASDMVIASQSVADDDGIRFIRIQRAISLVDEIKLRQHLAAFKREWLTEVRDLWCDDTDGC